MRIYFLSSSLRYAFGAVLVGILIAACSSTKKSSDQKEKSDKEGRSISVEGVNLTNPQNLAPGTAQVRMVVVEMVFKDGKKIWSSKIREVLGYGPATPPLGIGKTVNIGISSFFGNVDADPQKLAERDELICKIRHQEVPAGSDAPSWSLVQLFEQ